MNSIRSMVGRWPIVATLLAVAALASVPVYVYVVPALESANEQAAKNREQSRVNRRLIDANRRLIDALATRDAADRQRIVEGQDTLCKLKFAQLLVNTEVRKARSDPANPDYNPMVVAALDRTTRVLLSIRSSRSCVPPPNGSAQAFTRAARELAASTLSPTTLGVPGAGTSPSEGDGGTSTGTGNGGSTGPSASGAPPSSPSGSGGPSPPGGPGPSPPLLGPVTTPPVQVGPVTVPPIGVCVPHLTC